MLPLLLWPVHHLAGLVMAIATWISHWPGAQLAHRTSTAVGCCAAGGGLVALDAGGRTLPTALVAATHGNLPTRPLLGSQFGDGLVAVERFGRHRLFARHRGRAALVSTNGDARSCRIAQRLAAAHGHARLDWVMLLDPVATDVLLCWKCWRTALRLTSRAEPPSPLVRCCGPWFVDTTPEASRWSTGVAGGTPKLAAFPQPSGLVDTAGTAEISFPAVFHRNMAWLQALCKAAKLASAAWGWLAFHRPLKCLYVLGRVERWQSPVDRARLEIV